MSFSKRKNLFLSIIGIIAITSAFFAPAIGFDKDLKWGIGRSSLLLTGLILIIFPSAIQTYRKSPHENQLMVQMGAMIALILFGYIWQVSFGYWNKWPKTSDYFDLQANAFYHKQIALLEKPDPNLLALSDPYDMELRNKSAAQSIFDLSLYEGKYYLYWGPVPAILILPIKLFYSRAIGDHLITFWLLAGLFIMNCILAFDLWQTHYQSQSSWVFLIGIVMLGIINPIPWLLHRARVYQAAVSSGQFFLMGSLLWIYLAFKGNRIRHFHLVASGIFLSCAIASRITLVFPAAFILLMLIFRYNKEKLGGIFSFHKFNLIIILPLIFCGLFMGWYNKIRFNSYLEFGLKYQLNEVNYTKGYSIFSASYIPANIYNYLLNPVQLKGEFPFLSPAPALHITAFGMPIPNTYSPVAISGILSASPFVIMAGIAFYALYRKKIIEDDLRWLIITLIGAAGFSMAVLFIYFIAAMRFIEDFIPALALLAVIGFWQGCLMLAGSKFESLFKFTGLITAIATTSIGMVLAMSSINRVPTFTIPTQISEWVFRLFPFGK